MIDYTMMPTLNLTFHALLYTLKKCILGCGVPICRSISSKRIHRHLNRHVTHVCTYM